MPAIVDEPIWGYDNHETNTNRYESIHNKCTHISYHEQYDFVLVEEPDIDNYYLLDHFNKQIVYISKIICENGFYSQNIVWRNRYIKNLSGIASYFMATYYVQKYGVLYSDTAQSKLGRNMWVKLMYNYPSLKYGAYNYETEEHDSINIFEKHYQGYIKDQIALYVTIQDNI